MIDLERSTYEAFLCYIAFYAEHMGDMTVDFKSVLCNDIVTQILSKIVFSCIEYIMSIFFLISATIFDIFITELVAMYLVK